MSKTKTVLNQTVDIVIVGAGPTGLMAALLLEKCGISLRILDKDEQQAHESRAFALQARSLELLQSLGLVEAFLQRGLITSGAKLYVNSHHAATMAVDDIGAVDSPYAFILMLPQSDIENIFINELEKRDIQIERNKAVTSFTQDDDSVTVITVNKQGQTEQITATYLIGADGAHSVVRNILGLTFAGSAYPQNFMLADCAVRWPLDDEFIKVFMRENFLAVYFPMKGNTRGRIVTMNPDTDHQQDSAAAKLATTAEPLTLPEIEKAFQDATGLPVKLSDPVWVTRYRIHHRCVDKYNKGRVFVAGDAAHIHSPAGGQGMNTGLQDAANLVWKLALNIKSGTNKALLDTYHSERWPIGQKLLQFTDKLFGRISSQNKITALLRNIVMPLLMKLITKNAYYRKKAFHFISELGIHYHDNPFLWDDLSHKAHGLQCVLRAGHRAPNALYKRNHDIFSLINDYQFHVLALAKKSLSKVEIDTIAAQLALLPNDLGLPLHTHFIGHSRIGEYEKIIQAECNQVFENYGLTNNKPFGLFLIRPDSYIAYRSDELNITNLQKFCERFSGKSSFM